MLNKVVFCFFYQILADAWDYLGFLLDYRFLGFLHCACWFNLAYYDSNPGGKHQAPSTKPGCSPLAAITGLNYDENNPE